MISEMRGQDEESREKQNAVLQKRWDTSSGVP